MMMIFLTKLMKIVYIYWIRIWTFLIQKNNQCQLQQKSFTQKTTLQVPYIKGHPVIGTLIDLLRSGGAQQLHEYIDQRHKQNGYIFCENLIGNRNTIFVSSPHLIKSVFQCESQYPKHPLPEAWLLFNKKHNQQRGLFFMDGPEWFIHRQILNQSILVGNMDWMKAHIDACNENFLKNWTAGNTVNDDTNYLEIQDIEFHLYRWSIEVVCSIMFGRQLMLRANVEESLNRFAKIVRNIFDSTSSLMSFPAQIAKLLNLKMWQRFEKDVHQVLTAGSNIINTLILLFEESEEDNCLYSKLRKAEMSLDFIKRIFIDLIIAAGDTTAYSTEWALYLLATNKTSQQEILSEMLSNTNDKSYLRGFVKETLRLYPVAPFIGRYIEADSNIGGYFVKNKTLVIVSLYSAGRDEDNFSQPLELKPERWISSKRPEWFSHLPNASIPFGIGSRSCIGRRIALYQLESIVALIIENFHLDCLNSADIKPILRLVTVPCEPLQLRIKRRRRI